MSASPFGVGVRVLGAGAAVLALVLAVGVALPGSWSAEREAVVAAPVDVVYTLLEAPGAWRTFTDWPSAGMAPHGPPTGVGAGLTWDDPEVGSGAFEIVEAAPPRRVRYRVAVGGSTLRVEGTLELAEERGGTRVRWREEGAFGRNPLLRYGSRLMERRQGEQLERSLQRLDSAARAPGPATGG